VARGLGRLWAIVRGGRGLGLIKRRWSRKWKGDLGVYGGLCVDFQW